MERFWSILSITIGFYTKIKIKMKLSILFIIICIHISLNIDPRIQNPYTPEYPFPLAGHMYLSV